MSNDKLAFMCILLLIHPIKFFHGKLCEWQINKTESHALNVNLSLTILKRLNLDENIYSV